MTVDSGIMKFRKEIATDLRMIRDILYNHIEGNFSGIDTAITELNNSKIYHQLENYPSYSELWGYQLLDVTFRMNSIPAKSKPHPIEQLIVLFCIQASGNTEHLDTNKDPMEELKFDIVLRGKHAGKDVVSSFHLDRHILHKNSKGQAFNPDNPPANSIEPHPLYHIQFGGNKMLNEFGAIDTGNTLFLDSPRIPHYPMDFILGVDFILSNFFSEKWHIITETVPEYNNLIHKYQKRVLKPYLAMFNHHFENGKSDEHTVQWNGKMIKPQFIK